MNTLWERRLRAHARLAADGIGQADALLGVEDAVDGRRRYERLVDAVIALEPEDRDLLFLVAWENMSSREIADVLDLRPGTVRSRLNRIRNHLAKGMDDG